MLDAFGPGRAEAAFANWEQGMAIMRALNDSWGEAMGHMVAGNAFLRSGDLGSAQRHYEQSAPLFDEADYVYMANISRSGLADIARLEGDYERALALYSPVIRMWRLADHRGAIARCLECLGFIAGSQAANAADPMPLLRRAATLYGAAEAMRRINNTPMTPWEQTEYDGHVRALGSRLDPDALDAAWRTGARLDLDQAVDFATHHSAR
jgi:tetratricopeptide (TPR) repeat protein